MCGGGEFGTWLGFAAAKLAMLSAGTKFAGVRFATRMCQAVFDPLAHHFGREWVQTKRGGHQVTNAWVLASCGGGKGSRPPSGREFANAR